ncbi:MAG: CocE/NonD family hydrolase [Pseudomonadota bacterium]
MTSASDGLPPRRFFNLLAAALFGVVAAIAATACADRTEAPPIGRSKAYYLEMRDGVRVALNLYFPNGAEPLAPAPVILMQTRYGRAGSISGMERFLADGYVVATLDTRGSTSSFGPRRVDIGPDEVEDMDEVIAHLAAAPWSNGEVFAHGTSYLADTADIATSRPAPALKGAIIREVDFDVFANLFFPGGVPNDWFLHAWGEATRAMDEGRSPDPGADLDCRARAEDCSALWPVLDPVDGDDDFILLRQALAGRDRWTPDDYAGARFVDDAGANGYSLFSSAPANHLDGIRREARPAQIWGSWMDASTAEAALSRYRSAPGTPMEIWITGNDHPNTVFADPFFQDDTTPRPNLGEQHGIMTAFYDAVRAGAPIERRINYYILGADRFRTTDVWPPRDVAEEVFYLDAAGALSSAAPATGSDVYEVDFSHQTGAETRWSTQFDTPPAYRDRESEDAKLIAFDSAPLNEAMEIAGTPVIDLYVAARTDDPAFFVYLEDIAPDGRVTYITEGALRAIHRKPAAPADLAYDKGPAAHSLLRKDALPVTPGEAMRVEFALNPVAALIKKGHRIRVAIGGADACCFRRLSNDEAETFTFYRGGERASAIRLPMRPAEE